jgi:predicted SprT family Zn-dependent metalloprotease
MMQRAEVVLHEVAHALLFAHTKTRYAAHGPEFMGLYIELLYTTMGKDDITLTDSARARGIRVMAFEHIDMTSLNKPLYSY